MAIENEIKVLNVDPVETEKRILGLGGGKVGKTRLMRRYVFDIDPADQSKWIRLRDDGNQVTLTVKQIIHDGIDGVIENEIVVEDFEGTREMLALLGFSPKGYQENRRTSYLLEGAQVEVDQWPGIPTYLEIEADSPVEVLRIAELLGGLRTTMTSTNTVKVYASYGINLNEIADLRF